MGDAGKQTETEEESRSEEEEILPGQQHEEAANFVENTRQEAEQDLQEDSDLDGYEEVTEVPPTQIQPPVSASITTRIGRRTQLPKHFRDFHLDFN